MHEHDVIQNLKDAFLAGYYHGKPLGLKSAWELTQDEKASCAEAEAAAVKWALYRLKKLTPDY